MQQHWHFTHILCLSVVTKFPLVLNPTCSYIPEWALLDCLNSYITVDVSQCWLVLFFFHSLFWFLCIQCSQCHTRTSVGFYSFHVWTIILDLELRFVIFAANHSWAFFISASWMTIHKGLWEKKLSLRLILVVYNLFCNTSSCLNAYIYFCTILCVTCVV